MEASIQHWETLMDHAKQANSEAHYEQSLELNRSALRISQQNFLALFEHDPEQAIATVLVSYLSAIDNCVALSEFADVQILFNQALNFLQSTKQHPNSNPQQQSAIFHGASKLYYEWCHFTYHHRTQISQPEHDRFQKAISHLSSLHSNGINLH